MDVLSNINDEIASLSRQIKQEEGATEAVERLAQNASPEDVYRINAQLKGQQSASQKKIRLLDKRLKNLQLIRDEPDRAVVSTQEQNDHDEIWKHRDPGPDFANANRLPESHAIGK